jgi:hypothetical protein
VNANASRTTTVVTMARASRSRVRGETWRETHDHGVAVELAGRPSRAGNHRPSLGVRVARTLCRSRSGWRSSTTTARCGARSRCRSSSTSSCAAWRRWRRRSPSCMRASRGRPPPSATSPGLEQQWRSTTRGTTPM